LIVAETLRKELDCLDTCQHLTEGQFFTTSYNLNMCFSSVTYSLIKVQLKMDCI